MTYSDRSNSMPKNDCTSKIYESETIAPGIELLTERAGHMKSMYFCIPPMTQSLKSELHLLYGLLQRLRSRNITARAILHVIKSGNGPDFASLASGLVLFVGIRKGMPHEMITWLRVECRWVMRQIAKNKNLSTGHWRNGCPETFGYLSECSVTDRAETATNDILKTFSTKANATNCIVHYRVGGSGILESAVVDYAEEPTPLKWTPA